MSVVLQFEVGEEFLRLLTPSAVNAVVDTSSMSDSEATKSNYDREKLAVRNGLGAAAPTSAPVRPSQMDTGRNTAPRGHAQFRRCNREPPNRAAASKRPGHLLMLDLAFLL